MSSGPRPTPARRCVSPAAARRSTATASIRSAKDRQVRQPIRQVHLPGGIRAIDRDYRHRLRCGPWRKAPCPSRSPLPPDSASTIPALSNQFVAPPTPVSSARKTTATVKVERPAIGLAAAATRSWSDAAVVRIETDDGMAVNGIFLEQRQSRRGRVRAADRIVPGRQRIAAVERRVEIVGARLREQAGARLGQTVGPHSSRPMPPIWLGESATFQIATSSIVPLK